MAGMSVIVWRGGRLAKSVHCSQLIWNRPPQHVDESHSGSGAGRRRGAESGTANNPTPGWHAAALPGTEVSRIRWRTPYVWPVLHWLSTSPGAFTAKGEGG